MTRIETVTSAANPLLKELRRAISRGGLTAQGLCVAESFHLLEEALRSRCRVPVVLAADSAMDTVAGRVAGLRETRTIAVPDKLFQTVASTETSQGVMALVQPPVWSLEQLLRGASVIVVLDGLQDPGNAGAIVRAAEAFGASGVIFVKGSVNPWHPKTLRASAGSLFRVPAVAGLDASAASVALRQHQLDIYAAMPYTGSQHTGSQLRAEDIDWGRPCALIVGSEGRGVSQELRSVAEGVAIPTAGVESLNAAVAASILLYEAWRRRAPEARGGQLLPRAGTGN